MRNTSIAVVVLICAMELSVLGHHAEPDFDPKKMVSLTGAITKVEWVNPHARVFFNARDGTRTIQVWSFQLDSPLTLRAMGFPREVFKVGDEVTLKAMPETMGSHALYPSEVKLAGGKKWMACSPPRVISWRRC